MFDSSRRLRATPDVSLESAPPIVHQALRTASHPLDPASRRLMGSYFGHDLSRVRARTEGGAHDMVRTVSGRAFAEDFEQQVSAQLPGPPDEADLIHRPLIESFRREHGLPVSGFDELGERVGPSEAEIKYGGLAPTSTSVFYVSFQNVAPPSTPDHSMASPGPGGPAANRAGYTRVRVGKRMTIPWDTGPAEPDGRLPLYARSVNVFYRLDPIEVFVSSDYAEGSCPYRVTLAHERSHVRAFLQLFHAARDSLVGELNGTAVPTQAAPTLVEPANVEAEQDEIGERLRDVILAHSAGLVGEMEADRDSKDAPSAYSVEYARCPADEW